MVFDTKRLTEDKSSFLTNSGKFCQLKMPYLHWKYQKAAYLLFWKESFAIEWYVSILEFYINLSVNCSSPGYLWLSRGTSLSWIRKWNNKKTWKFWLPAFRRCSRKFICSKMRFWLSWHVGKIILWILGFGWEIRSTSEIR